MIYRLDSRIGWLNSNRYTLWLFLNCFPTTHLEGSKSSAFTIVPRELRICFAGSMPAKRCSWREFLARNFRPMPEIIWVNFSEKSPNRTLRSKLEKFSSFYVDSFWCVTQVTCTTWHTGKRQCVHHALKCDEVAFMAAKWCDERNNNRSQPISSLEREVCLCQWLKHTGAERSPAWGN